MITATATLKETISVTASLGGSVCLPATYTLVDTDTPPNTLDSGSIASGAAATIVAPAATVTVNTTPFNTAPSGGSLNVPVVSEGANPVGSIVAGEVVIANTDVSINTVPVDSLQAEDPFPLTITLNGSAPAIPVTYNAGTKTADVTSGAIGSVSVAVSDAAPDFGDTITITATPTGLTPTSYLFFAFDGTDITFIVEQAGAVVNWIVSLSGTFDIYALVTNGSLEVYGTVEVTATSTLILDSIGVVPNFAISLRRLTINYTGPACVVMRSSDSDTLPIPYIGEHLDTATLISFVGIGNGFSATLFDQVGSNNAIQSTAAAIPSIVISGTVQTINGRPAIVFDGTTDQMVLASNVVFAHAFAVARKTANVNGAQMLFGATGGVGISVGGTFSTYNNISIITTGGVVSSTIDNTVAHQISFRLGSGGTAQIMVDGVIAKTGTTSATLSCSHVGTDPQFNSRHVGFLSELFTFSSTLSDANRNILNANQKSYYGTP